MKITQRVPNLFFGMLDFRDFKVKWRQDLGLKVYTDVMRDVVNNHQDYGTELKSKLPGKDNKYNVGGKSIKQLRVSFGSIYLLFSFESSRGPRSSSSWGKSPAPSS